MKVEATKNYSRKKYHSIRLFCMVLLIVLAFSVSSVAVAQASVWYVKIDGSDSNSGSSWDGAFETIQTAISAASHWDEIWVRQGTYEPVSWILVNKMVGIYGGFAGTETERDQRNWRNNVTTVDGRSVIDHCFYIDFAMDYVVIDGFTITGGYSDGPDESNPYRKHDSGGGIFIKQSAATIANCTFIDNTATGSTFGGGAIFVSGMNAPTIVNCAFYGNKATGGFTHGGAIHIASSNPSVTNCIFAGNTAGGDGGAIVINGNTPTIINCTFTGNEAFARGGAIYSVNSATPTIRNCIFWGDSLTSGGVNDGYEIYDDTISQSNVDYCDVQGGGTPGQTWFQNGTHNFSEDPLFIDAGNDDLHIMPTSPCVDTGDNLAVPANVTSDMDGDVRIINGTVDIGADEYKRVWYVDGGIPSSGNGMFWTEAFQTIDEAVAAAESGHEIWVKQGEYPLTSSINLNKMVHLIGGFDGTEILRSERDWYSNPTTVNGQDGIPHCFVVSHDATIDGFTITGGNANGSDPDDKGGAIYISASSADITNCVIIENDANLAGGGIYNLGSGTIANCLIFGNGAANGGGIANDNSTPTIVNCTLANNDATDGGGIWNNNAASTITNCMVWGNTASDGPGMFVTGAATPTLTYSNVEGGPGQGWFDGGAANLDTDPLFVDELNNDFHLQLTSPCIDAGDNAAVPVEVVTDFDGDPRLVDGDEDGTETVDIGVDEYTHVPTIWYVDGTAQSCGDGNSWDTAFNTMEDAIDNHLLRSSDEIWVKAGRYIPPPYEGWGELYNHLGMGLIIEKEIKLYGGFPVSMPNPQWTDRDWRSNETIIDARANPSDWNSGRQRGFYIKGDRYAFNSVGAEVIDGFIITGGKQYGGAGIWIEHTMATISNCVITGNHSLPGGWEWGGGIRVAGDTAAVTIVNCVISGNTAEYGGALGFLTGLASQQYHPRVINCTITGNKTTGVEGISAPGATIEYRWGNGARLEMVNSIVWNNITEPEGVELFFWDNNTPPTNDPHYSIIDYCDVEGGTGDPWFDPGIDMDADPLFIAPGSWDDNGTTGDDSDDFWVDGDYHLQEGSPCIDAGYNSAVPTSITEDMDGDGRILDGDENGTATVDIGADEYIDTDSDGVQDSEEMGPDGDDPSYDGNDDGTADSQQDNVASMHTYNDEDYVTVASPGGTALSNVRAIAPPGTPPGGVDFEYGCFDFTVTGVGVGGSTSVTIFGPVDAVFDTYYKYGPTAGDETDHWYEFLFDGETGAVFNGNEITLYLVDGQRGDGDLIANGVIVEPGGPAMITAEDCEGDFDGDGDVDGSDLAVFAVDFGRTDCGSAPPCEGDFDHDGDVDGSDLAVFAADFGRTDCP